MSLARSMGGSAPWLAFAAFFFYIHETCATSLVSCPGGSECSTGVALPCPIGFFCPEGQVNATTCNFYTLIETMPNMSLPTASNTAQTVAVYVYILGQPLAGNICPVGSMSPFEICPKGNYCPDPSQVIPCPSGSYCKAGWAAPRPCSKFSRCPAGSSAPGVLQDAIVGVIFLLILMFLVYIAVYALVRARTRQVNAQRDKRERLATAVAPLLGQKYDRKASHIKLFANIEPRITIRFKGLGLELKDGTSVLSGVTGEFRHSRLFAVMGPSGAGKSTFFNTLTGSASGYGTITGQVWINEEEKHLTAYKDIIGFVPQDDIVHEDMTVLENLVSSAYLRLPHKSTGHECRALADAVIDLLGIRHVCNSVVGSVVKRGISGGQRKRVNIGMELVTRPSVCFMDEPTSGLDSSATLEVLAALKSVTSKGMLISCVIHQPRYSVFILFDELLLLAKGGVTAYMGPTEQMLPYFNHVGFSIAENENPADFMLDVCAGALQRQGHPDFKPSDLWGIWQENGSAFISQGAESARSFMSQRNMLVQLSVNALPERLEAIMTALEEVQGAQVAALTQPPSSQQGQPAEAWGPRIDLSRLVLDQEQMKLFLELLAQTVVPTSDVLEVMKVVKKDNNGTVTGRDIQDFLIKGGGASPVQIPVDDFNAYDTNTKEKGDVEQGGMGVLLCMTGLTTNSGNRIKPGFVIQTAILCVRTLVKKARNWPNMIVNLFLILFCGAIAGVLTGAAYLPVAFIPGTLQMQVCFSLIMGVCSMYVFTDDRVILIRETKTGISTLAVFLASNIIHLIDIFLLPLIFLGFYYGFVFPVCSFQWYYLAVLMTSWYASGVSYMMSVLMNPTNAIVSTVAFILILNNFVSGTAPPTNANDSGSSFRFASAGTKFLYGLSSTRWGVEITSIKEFSYYPEYLQPQVHFYMTSVGFCGMDSYISPYDLRTYPSYINQTLADDTSLNNVNVQMVCSNDVNYIVWDFLAILLLGFVWRLFAFGILWMKLRPEVPGPYQFIKIIFSRLMGACCRTAKSTIRRIRTRENLAGAAYTIPPAPQPVPA